MSIDNRFSKTNYLLERSLIELLQKKSFEKITIDDICDHAVVGRSTFYHHFADKYLLLNSLVEHYTRKFQSLLDQRESQITDNDFLVYLYEELFQDRVTWLTLLSIKSSDNNLATNLQKILKKSSGSLLLKTNQTLPNDFLNELYAVNALSAITWTLKNGHSQEIAAFMNDSLQQILQ